MYPYNQIDHCSFTVFACVTSALCKHAKSGYGVWRFFNHLKNIISRLYVEERYLLLAVASEMMKLVREG